MAVAICANCRRPLASFSTRLCPSCAITDPSGKYHRCVEVTVANQTWTAKRRGSAAIYPQPRERAGWSWRG